MKAVLQYTAEQRAGYNSLTQGAGFLNALGAVRLARFFAVAEPGRPYPIQSAWSKKLIWGSHRLSGGALNPSANAFALGTTWGVAHTNSGDNIIWGTTCDGGCDNIIWGTSGSDNVIWGAAGDDDIVWGTETEGENIIWGTEVADENIIWGTDCGGADCDNIIWGTEERRETTSSGAPPATTTTSSGAPRAKTTSSGAPLGQGDAENIIWGTEESDNIIWGTSQVAVSGWPASTSYPVLLWDYYYALYSRYLASYTDDQFFGLIDSLTSFLNPWRRFGDS